MTAEAVWVLGGGGHGKVAVATLRAAGWPVAAVLDDDERLWGRTVLGVEVVGPIRGTALKGRRALLAIGANAARHALASELTGAEWAVCTHPRAWVEEGARLGEGVLVCAGAVVQAEAEVGPHAIINTCASVDHDCRIGAFVHVAPGARLGGNVTIGEGTLVGIGSVILPGVHVGKWATVGAGAVVVDDVADGTVVAGVPAREIPRKV